ncbi:hypothetical protein LF1_32960 [Rubripirellula obstinata]|uniref:Uncharacterized protein n=1 Tax=Rubripirellula obstinata TaxID=406547 RepID=A0A5B1CLI6_9BACT|nr:hypothetical protein [Rubripirellula obstinata]KAA1260755.1 hypothetical protein LF1_32960 [Rubripirellula obstinata]
MLRSKKRILCRSFGLGTFLAFAFVVGTGLWIKAQSKFVPDFYSQAKTIRPLPSIKASRNLQSELRRFQSDRSKRGRWNTALSDQQVNAWLIEELPRAFPRLLAYGAREPRIKVEDDRILAAVRFQRGQIDTVISCEATVELTEQPNMLALRLHHLRAGAIPLPLNKFVRGISKEAAKGGLDIDWDFTDSGPVALVTIPSEDPRYHASPVVIESVNLVRGAMVLAGHTGDITAEEFKPVGSTHEFVSYLPRIHRRAQMDRANRKESLIR